MEAGYLGVHLWAQAAHAADPDDVAAIRRALPNQSFEAPGGRVRIDAENQHTWKTMRLGRIVEGGQFEIVWSFRKADPPGTLSRLTFSGCLGGLSEQTI